MTSYVIPVIETERLRLRAPSMADFEAYAEFGTTERTAGVRNAAEDHGRDKCLRNGHR